LIALWIGASFKYKIMRKRKVWYGLTTFGWGLIIGLIGVFIKSAGSLVMEDLFSMILTTIGIIVFIAGLYIALLGMDSQFKDLKEMQFLVGKKK
jgi:hypothetical protein